MKSELPKDELIEDLFGEAASPGFREEVLAQTLNEVRRRKHTSRRLSAFSALLAVVAALALGLQFWPASTPPRLVVQDQLLVHSRPLAPQAVVANDPRGVEVVHSSLATFALVETTESTGALRLISDPQLLALFGGRPVALVYHGPAQAELLFLNPDDKDGFPAQ